MENINTTIAWLYGTQLLKYLSEQLTRDFGKGFTVTNLTYMRPFYNMFPIRHALRDKLAWTHLSLIWMLIYLIGEKQKTNLIH